ncbi:hypothetical protein AALP_AA1G301200 [Arabis alpina]|uniref:DUF4283 domain-containing protein n=1 Tax=Arabis alpina TaxID=50452 RepID=A0A087HRM1_ARAAL|nr:hypothetical protein AALP_AA1G301200 [Arabis alpina]
MDTLSSGPIPPKPPPDPSFSVPPPSKLVVCSEVVPSLAPQLEIHSLASVSVTSAPVSKSPVSARLVPRSGSYSSVVSSGSLRNLRKVGSPSFLADGTPSVSAPESVLFQKQEVWKDHLVAHFHGSPPSPAKIFSDLNPIWGTHGRIAIRQYAAQTCLIFIPSEATRKWVLEVGFWQAGNCAFTVTNWSSSACLAPMKLDYAPLWVILKNVPSQLYDFEGLSVIASGLGIPLYTEKAKLQPNRYGVAKVKVVMKLDQKFPLAVRVRDKLGNSVTVLAEYPHIPHRCQGCKEFRHLLLRFPKIIVIPDSQQSKSLPIVPKLVKGVYSQQKALKDSDIPSESSPEDAVNVSVLDSPELQVSLHSDTNSSSVQWTSVVNRSSPPDVSHPTSSTNRKDPPLSAAKIQEEADLVQEAQQKIRERALSLLTTSSPPKSAKAKRRLRKRLRQKLLSESAEQDPYPTVSSTISLIEVNQVISPSGRSHDESIPQFEA